MPSEPLEAEFISPPALTQAQEEEFRQLDLEGPIPLTRTATAVSGPAPDLGELERGFTRNGIHVVVFEKGKGEDPREFGRAMKWYITLAVSFLCLSVAIGSSIITGDMKGPVEEFGTTQEIVNLTVACFVIGFGIGPLFFAPLSEVVGRTLMYQVSMLFFFIFTLPSALSKNAATLVVARQIAGLAASAPICNVGGTVADIWAVEERGIPMAVFSFTLFMGPCLGPLFGGWIAEKAGWRWMYWVLFIFTGVCFAFTLFIPETLASLLLRRKAAKLRKSTGDESYRTLEELERVPFFETLKISLLRPIVMLVAEPIVALFSLYLSFIYSLLYLFFFAFPIAFEEVRGFGMGMTGVTFVSIMIGIGLAMMLVPYQEKIYRKATVYGTYPEARLFPMMAGAIILPIGLFIFAFTGGYSWVHWIGPCISGGVFGFALIIIYISANSYIVDSYSSFAASAIAAKTFLRSEIGAAVPLYSTQMFHNMGFQYAGLLLALVSVAIAPIPFVFYVYGEKIRQRSKKATQSVKMSGPAAKNLDDDLEKPAQDGKAV
ncbi:spermine transporter [Desarmillaria tabescens]|uniref:Spermine transporter n=1 Tax=Armillaria tabescens TaxID=1929756 RepID=A0AA39N5Q5_ARMTA|nr:spermine transporter [Desarmillaria tabescens]KAK0458255.1 spermine transporter [Desarmillaria tabescens]